MFAYLHAANKYVFMPLASVHVKELAAYMYLRLGGCMHACFPVTEVELNMQYFATAGSNPLKLETCDTKTSNSPIYEYYVRNCNLYSQFLFILLNLQPQ